MSGRHVRLRLAEKLAPSGFQDQEQGRVTGLFLFPRLERRCFYS